MTETPTVLVSIPYYRCTDTIRRAVKSVLAQTHDNLRVLVINDGDDSSRKELAGIDDSRLIIYDLPENRGRYFADAVALMANPFSWFSVHDADDWSEPERLERLFNGHKIGETVAVFGAQWVYKLDGSRYKETCNLLGEPLAPELRHLAHHAGIYQTKALRNVGGYRPDFRVGYDSLIVNLLKMAYPVASTDEPLYHRVARVGSLTRAEETRFGSLHREEAKRHIMELYRQCMATDKKPETIAKIILDDSPEDMLVAVEEEAGKMRGALSW